MSDKLFVFKTEKLSKCDGFAIFFWYDVLAHEELVHSFNKEYIAFYILWQFVSVFEKLYYFLKYIFIFNVLKYFSQEEVESFRTFDFVVVCLDFLDRPDDHIMLW